MVVVVNSDKDRLDETAPLIHWNPTSSSQKPRIIMKKKKKKEGESKGERCSQGWFKAMQISIDNPLKKYNTQWANASSSHYAAQGSMIICIW